jgi:hypothetical protein
VTRLAVTRRAPDTYLVTWAWATVTALVRSIPFSSMRDIGAADEDYLAAGTGIRMGWGICLRDNCGCTAFRLVNPNAPVCGTCGDFTAHVGRG